MNILNRIPEYAQSHSSFSSWGGLWFDMLISDVIDELRVPISEYNKEKQ